MADESTEMSTSRLVLWGVVGVLLIGAIAAYFRYGTRVPPFGSAPAAGTAPADSR
jgi:hypothetical protein